MAHGYTYKEARFTPYFFGVALCQKLAEKAEFERDIQYDVCRKIGTWVLQTTSKHPRRITPQSLLELPSEVRAKREKVAKTIKYLREIGKIQ